MVNPSDTDILIGMMKNGKPISPDELTKLATIGGKLDYARLIKYTAMAEQLYKNQTNDKNANRTAIKSDARGNAKRPAASRTTRSRRRSDDDAPSRKDIEEMYNRMDNADAKKASWLARVAAFLIDGCIITVIFFFLIGVFGLYKNPMGILLFFGTFVLYFAFFESSSFQATPGKWLFHLKVVDDQKDKRISFSIALWRGILKYFLWIIAGKGINMFSGTEVVNDNWLKENDPKTHLQDEKNRRLAMFLAVFVGFWGIDRFYLGYKKIGVLKFFTLGGLGILWLYDIYCIFAKKGFAAKVKWK